MRFTITLLQLETFCAVVDSGSTVTAAQKLFTSQSSISKTLSRLEENLGVSLFIRQHGKLELTDAGRNFATSVSSILNQLEDSIQDTRLIAQAAHPALRMAASSYLAHDLVLDYSKAHPSTHVNLQLYQERHLKQMLTNKEVNLILSTSPDSYSSSIYHWVPMMSCEVLVVIPSGHPLSSKSPILFQDLEHEAFVCNNIGLNSDFIRQMFKANHMHLSNLLECNDDRIFMDYMNQYKCLTFLPAYALVTTERHPSAREVRISDSKTVQHFGLVYRSDAPSSPELEDFIAHAQQFCARLEEQTNHFLQDFTEDSGV